jgi:hypothetical protein
MKNTIHDRAESRNKNQSISTENEPDAAPKWKRHFERGTPKDALTWKGARQRWSRMLGWQIAVSTKFTSIRALRVAWLLDHLCQLKGYAYSTDAYISTTLNIPLNKVQTILTDLERAGAIVRASSFVDGKPQRHIWPSTKIIPVTETGIDNQDDTPPRRGVSIPPSGARGIPPSRGGTDTLEYTRSRKSSRISSTADAARLDAERRERRRATAPDDDTPASMRGEPQATPRRQEADEIDAGRDAHDARPAPKPPRPIVVQIDDIQGGRIIDTDGVEYIPPHDKRRPPPRPKSNVDRGRDMLKGILQ